jgi:hypothetical protein
LFSFIHHYHLKHQSNFWFLVSVDTWFGAKDRMIQYELADFVNVGTAHEDALFGTEQSHVAWNAIVHQVGNSRVEVDFGISV